MNRQVTYILSIAAFYTATCIPLAAETFISKFAGRYNLGQIILVQTSTPNFHAVRFYTTLNVRVSKTGTINGTTLVSYRENSFSEIPLFPSTVRLSGKITKKRKLGSARYIAGFTIRGSDGLQMKGKGVVFYPSGHTIKYLIGAATFAGIFHGEGLMLNKKTEQDAAANP